MLLLGKDLRVLIRSPLLLVALVAYPLAIASLVGLVASFVLVALWLCAGAVREPETARWRLALAGVALGLSMAAKWNAIPVAALTQDSRGVRPGPGSTRS